MTVLQKLKLKLPLILDVIWETHLIASHHPQSILHTILSFNLTLILGQTIAKGKQPAEVIDVRFQMFVISSHTNTNPNRYMHATCLFRQQWLGFCQSSLQNSPVVGCLSFEVKSMLVYMWDLTLTQWWQTVIVKWAWTPTYFDIELKQRERSSMYMLTPPRPEEIATNNVASRSIA